MKGKGNEPGEMTSVQRELDIMAQEVPEMPEEFRKAWRLAIREEAATRAAETEKISALPAEEEQHRAAASNISALRTRRWTGILSAAAAMVFLIGGTLATRNSLSPRLRTEQALTTDAGGNLVLETGLPMAEALKDGADLEFNTKEITMDVVLTQEIGETEEDAAEEPATEPENATAEPTDSRGAVSTAEPDEAGKGGFWAEVRFFLEDMGAFVKAAWPYLAGAAAVSVIILLVRRHKRK